MYAIIKRTTHGIYHHISKKFLLVYLNEFEYHFNSKKNVKLHEFNHRNGLKVKSLMVSLVKPVAYL